jgi:hypothetical protein
MSGNATNQVSALEKQIQKSLSLTAVGAPYN